MPAPMPMGFAFRPKLPAGSIPTAVVAGDFNSDGHIDWAVSNGADNTIWLYFGRGDGTSDLPIILPLSGVSPVWLTTADLRGDGKLDLIVAEADSGTIGVMLGNGDGTFQPEIDYALPASPLFVVAKDFTGDGRLDLAIGLYGTVQTGPIALLPGDGMGHFAAPIYAGGNTISVAQWLAAADMNGDGKLDLISAAFDPNDIEHGGAQVYLNNGNGTFTAGQLVFENSAPPNLPPQVVLSVDTKDLNSDGCADAAVTDSWGDVFVYQGNCDGTFGQSPTPYMLGDIGGAVQLIDVNGDGNADIVSSGVLLPGAGGFGLGAVAGNDVSILFGDGTGHFGTPHVYRGEPSMYGMAVADVNGDGFPDIVTANQGNNSATVFLNDSHGGFGDPQGEFIGYNSGITNSPASPFVFADVDNNGTTDLVLLQYPRIYPGPMQLTSLLNDGTGRFSEPIRTPLWNEQDLSAPGSLLLADFRNTGRADAVIVAMDFLSPFIVFAPNIGGGQFGPFTVTTSPGALGPASVGDFNGDGKLDLTTVWYDSLDNDAQKVTVFLGNGDGTFQPGQTTTFAYPSSNPGNPNVVYVGDFNRDGKLDLLIWDGALYELLGNGDGTFQPAQMLFPAFAGFVVADVNGDGWPDILATTDQYGNPADYIPELSVFIGQPDGSFRYSQNYAPFLGILRPPYLSGVDVFPSLFELVSGDFNGDGKVDMAVAVFDPVSTATIVQVLYGNGEGTVTPDFVSYSVDKFFVPQFAADLNGDGRSDLVELDNFTSSFNVMKASAAPFLQLRLLNSPITGTTGYGRVVLDTASPSTTNVTLTASDPNVQAPTVVIPAGSVSQDFTFSIGPGFDSHHVFSIEATAGGATSTAYGYATSPAAPVVQLEPSGILFGDVYLLTQTALQNVTLKNLGGGPLTISSLMTMRGEGDPQLPESNDCGGSVAPGASCTIQVAFVPLSTGLATGTLVLDDNIAGIHRSLPIQGSGLNLLQVNPCCLSFSQLVGTTSAAQSVTVTNVGPINVAVENVSVSGSGFSLASNGCGTLAPSATCLIGTSFKPTSVGSFTGRLSFSTDKPETGLFAVTLTGTGTDFSLGSAPSQTIAPGQTATYDLTLSSDGFSGTIALSCNGAPPGSTCSVNPSSMSVSAGASVPYVVTVTSTPQTAATSSMGDKNHRRGTALASILICWAMMVVSARKRVRHGLLMLITGSVLLSASCGGRGVTGGGTIGTSPGTYDLKITGSVGSASRTTTIQLIVS